MVALRKTRLTVDIGPLLEMQWTGIPVFTRRAVQSLMMHDDVHLDFAFDMVKVPNALVYGAMQANSGGFLRDSYERHAGELYRTVDPQQPIFYPTVKQHLGAVQREASTVHDMSTLLMPENHEISNVDFHMEHLRDELATSEVVFCVSEATESALVTAYPSVKSKARVLYQYADWPADFEAIDANLPLPSLGRYALVIGTLEPRKNLSIIFDILSQPEVRDSDLRFVVIGRKGWKVESLLEQIAPLSRERIIFSGYVTEFVKYRLLRHCEFLVFPSIYEGFGIPALEALSLGKPVLASMTSSFPEVIGEAGVFFDPCSPESFIDGLRRISSPKINSSLSAVARLQAGRFSPDVMAKPLLEWARQG